jgi:hypothetical protein
LIEPLTVGQINTSSYYFNGLFARIVQCAQPGGCR